MVRQAVEQQCCTVLCCTVLYFALLYCTALYCTALFCTLYTRTHDFQPAQSIAINGQSIIPDATPMHLLYPASGHLSLFIVYRRKDTRVRPRNEPGWMAKTGNTGKWCEDVTRRSRSCHKHPKTPHDPQSSQCSIKSPPSFPTWESRQPCDCVLSLILREATDPISVGQP